MGNLEVKVWVIIVTIVYLGGLMFWGTHNINARLSALEVASTCAQQPKKRHYSDTLETIYYFYPGGSLCVNGECNKKDTSLVIHWRK
jgi:hypothetical protein